MASAAGNDGRLGIRWGLAGGVGLASVAEVAAGATWAADVGFDSFWVSQSTAVDPVVALAAACGDGSGPAEVGTSVVPLYGRHPLGVAQMVRTAQSTLGGRFTLGVGPSHREPVETSFGLSWARPLGYTKEFLDGLQPLLAGEPVAVEGEQLVTRAELHIDAPGTPVLVAALGPRMLALAGARADGTTVGQCGPNTVATHIAPLLNAAAAEAGRPTPRIVALVRLCVTDDLEPAKAQAREIAARYTRLPSYAAMVAKEGLDEPADLHLIGSWEQILDGLARYAEAGVTDLRLEVVAPDETTWQASRDALATHLA